MPKQNLFNSKLKIQHLKFLQGPSKRLESLAEVLVKSGKNKIIDKLWEIFYLKFSNYKDKNGRKYMLTKLKLEIEKLDNGEFLITSKELPDLIAQGRTANEAMEIANDVARKLFESYVERNIPLPEVFKNSEDIREASLLLEIPG
jgi:predicted RNase H-like HicB family nuclease